MTTLHKSALAALLSTTLLTAPALADEVEVLHWWTSGGEAAAVAVLQQDLEGRGIGWKDMAVSGGGGDAAEATLRARVVSGNPPTAAQMLGMSVREWANEGVLGNLNEVADAEGWNDVIPPAVQAFGTFEGAWVAAPVNIHRPHWMWGNAAIFEELGLSMPTNWDEFFAAADAIQEAGYIAVAQGGQSWQEATVWEAIVLSISPDLYEAAIINADIEALGSDDITQSFEIYRRILSYADPGYAGRDWNLATAMVLNGEAGLQIMGDWAKGEVINAGFTPGEEILCAVVPGTDGSFLFNTDFFAMFEVGEDAQAAQLSMASAAMSVNFQETFNLAKGSIPARTDVPGDNFDKCGQTSMADLVSAADAGTLFGSLAHGHGQPAAIQGAYIDVITQFANSDDMSAESAKDALVASVSGAL